jgi:haloalkane dehalogenase
MNFNGFATVATSEGIIRRLPPEAADLYTRPFRPLDRRGIAAFYPGQITAATDFFAEVEAGLPRLAGKRALIFWALNDAGFPRPDLEKFRKAFPHNTTIELPGLDHFFFEDAKDEMIPHIHEFMASDQE